MARCADGSALTGRTGLAVKHEVVVLLVVVLVELVRKRNCSDWLLSTSTEAARDFGLGLNKTRNENYNNLGDRSRV